MDARELTRLIADVEKQMRKSAADLNFEAAAELRDRMVELKKHLLEVENTSSSDDGDGDSGPDHNPEKKPENMHDTVRKAERAAKRGGRRKTAGRTEHRTR